MICRAQRNGSGSFSRSLIGASLLLAFAAAPALASPSHVADAQTLLTDLTTSRQNVYGSSPSYIYWTGTSSRARTVCGTFITNLLEHSYGWTSSTFSSWMGTTSPNATIWHDAIVAQNNFTQINDLSQVVAGDIIAVKYPAGSGVSGHAMMVAAAPRQQGSNQYAVTVIDSSSGHHGSKDTRVTNPSGSGNGVGRGDILIVVNSARQPTGHAWSAESGSQVYSMSERPLAIGRLNVGHLSALNAAAVVPGSSHATAAAGATADQLGNAGEVTMVLEDNPAQQTDDDTAVGADGATSPQAGGCTVVPGAQAGAALPISLLGLAVLLGLRRRARASSARLIGNL